MINCSEAIIQIINLRGSQGCSDKNVPNEYGRLILTQCIIQFIKFSVQCTWNHCGMEIIYI
jgi:hypothetical protein